MGKITTAHAYMNNEVAYVAWDIDEKIEGCLGFEVIRVYLDENGDVAKTPDGHEDRVTCAASAFRQWHSESSARSTTFGAAISLLMVNTYR